MSAEAIVVRARDVFQVDAGAPPPLTLRGASAVDSHEEPPPFEPRADEPTDAYLEGFAFCGTTYLDARSWRHYLPRLIDYAFRHPDDPAMVTDALVRSLRPPDRYPPRLGTLDADQESVVRSFLEHVALGDAFPHLQTEAQQALEEWWLPGARSRPTTEQLAAARAVSVAYRRVERDVYRLSVPETLVGSGLHEIPQEARRTETFGGYLCGDAYTVVAVNVTPLLARSQADSVRARTSLFCDAVRPHSVVVRGAPTPATRLEGLTRVSSPAEPQTLVMVFATARDQLVTMSVRAWPRDDVDREVERIVRSFEIASSSPPPTSRG